MRIWYLYFCIFFITVFSASCFATEYDEFNKYDIWPVLLIPAKLAKKYSSNAKFKRLIKEGKYDEAIEVAKAQVEDGAMILDVNVDDGMVDGVKAMGKFLRLAMTEPDVSKIPIMIEKITADFSLNHWAILPVNAPAVGRNTSAVSRDAVKTTMTISGR